jgi:hypothetical protein
MTTSGDLPDAHSITGCFAWLLQQDSDAGGGLRDLLAPGSEATHTDRVVTGATSLQATANIVEWFSCHDGTRDGLRHALTAAPVRLISLYHCAVAREELLQRNADFAPDFGNPHHFWLPHLWPIADLAANGIIGVDLMPDANEALYLEYPDDTGLTRLPESIGTLPRLLRHMSSATSRGSTSVSQASGNVTTTAYRSSSGSAQFDGL